MNEEHDSTKINISSPVQYGLKFKGWHKCMLTLSNDTLKLTDVNGEGIFSYPVSDITKVQYNHTLFLGINTSDNKNYLVSFGGVKAYAAESVSGLAGMSMQNRQDEKAQNVMSPWLEFFNSKGLVVNGFNLYKFRKISSLILLGLFVIVIIFVIIIAIALYIHSH
jgi:hypothetical protein